MVMCILIFLMMLISYASVFPMAFVPFEDQKDTRFMKGAVQMPLCPELYPFFTKRMSDFNNVAHIMYDSNKKAAFCFFKEVVDTHALKDASSFTQFLSTDTKPRRGHMHRPLFVLNAFAKLQEILSQTRIFTFNEQKDTIILNPAFGHFDTPCPDIFEYFGSIEYSLHACAYIARVPVASYHHSH